MKNDNLRKGFTLAEIMVALVVIGIITSIILPVAYNNLPSEKIMKFKKGNATLAKVINELVVSGKYYMAGDLGTDNNGNGVSSTYFCETFSDLVTTKKINCLNTNNGNYSIGMYRLEGMGSETLTDKTTSALKYVDSMCKQYHPKDKNNKDTFEIITSDNVKYYTINPATTFSTKVQNGSYDMFSPCLQTYKIMCMQIEDEIFGYGIRKDGRIMAGERALAWMEKSIQSKEDENDVQIQDINVINVTFATSDAILALTCKTKPYQNSIPSVDDNSSNSSGGSSSSGSSSGGSSSGGSDNSSSSGSSGGSSGSTSGGSSSGGSGSSSGGSTSSGSNSGGNVNTASSKSVNRDNAYMDTVYGNKIYHDCAAAASSGCTKCSRTDLTLHEYADGSRACDAELKDIVPHDVSTSAGKQATIDYCTNKCADKGCMYKNYAYSPSTQKASICYCKYCSLDGQKAYINRTSNNGVTTVTGKLGDMSGSVDNCLNLTIGSNYSDGSHQSFHCANCVEGFTSTYTGVCIKKVEATTKASSYSEAQQICKTTCSANSCSEEYTTSYISTGTVECSCKTCKEN